jgi:hypothetical protein
VLRRASSAALLLIALVAAAPAWAAKAKADLAEKSVKTSVTSVLDGGTVKVTDVTKNGG